jgi:hypothetical protein
MCTPSVAKTTDAPPRAIIPYLTFSSRVMDRTRLFGDLSVYPRMGLGAVYANSHKKAEGAQLPWNRAFWASGYQRAYWRSRSGVDTAGSLSHVGNAGTRAPLLRRFQKEMKDRVAADELPPRVGPE